VRRTWQRRRRRRRQRAPHGREGGAVRRSEPGAARRPSRSCRRPRPSAGREPAKRCRVAAAGRGGTPRGGGRACAAAGVQLCARASLPRRRRAMPASRHSPGPEMMSGRADSEPGPSFVECELDRTGGCPVGRGWERNGGRVGEELASVVALAGVRRKGLRRLNQRRWASRVRLCKIRVQQWGACGAGSGRGVGDRRRESGGGPGASACYLLTDC
jgi:hypothetical protein